MLTLLWYQTKVCLLLLLLLVSDRTVTKIRRDEQILWAKGFDCQNNFVLTLVGIWVSRWKKCGHRVNFGSLNRELCLNAQNKTSRKWHVNNLVVFLAIWFSSAALLFVNSKFYVLTSDDCTVELHYPSTIWKGISQVLKQFLVNIFFIFMYI